MIDITNMSTLMGLAGAVTALGGAWLTIRKVAKDIRMSKKRQSAELLQLAKEADTALKLELNNKIHELEGKLIDLQEDMQKDLFHLKETYNGELRFLGQKIEELRKEVHDQHGQLVALLMKMIDK